jgi:hypothetical protein
LDRLNKGSKFLPILLAAHVGRHVAIVYALLVGPFLAKAFLAGPHGFRGRFTRRSRLRWRLR